MINYLDVSLQNDSEFTIDNLTQTNDDRGKLTYLNNIAIGANAFDEIADFKMNLFGQLSQDLTFNLFDKDSNTNIGSCKLHLGVGSYVAKPDFTGSSCTLQNGDYAQLSPTYTTDSNTYHVKYKLSRSKNFSRIILFGDSMSDNGNLHKRSVELSLIFPISPVLPVSPPYYKGRFTNGKVWVEHLAKMMNIPEGSLLNYAYAGASVQSDYMPIPNLQTQVNKYLTWNHTGDPYALYVVWIGSNDLLRHNDLPQEQLIANISSGIESNIRRLISHGAKHILSPGLPDLSFTPDSMGQDLNNGNNNYTNYLKSTAFNYNKTHNEMLNKLKREFPDVEFMTFNFFKFLNETHDRAAEFGFYNIDERCNPNSYWKDELEVCNMPREYVFWDGIHPTAKAHEILSSLIYKVVASKGYEPNAKTIAGRLPEEFEIRNKQAIEELQKDIDVSAMTSKGALGSPLETLRIVVEKNIPLM